MKKIAALGLTIICTMLLVMQGAAVVLGSDAVEGTETSGSEETPKMFGEDPVTGEEFVLGEVLVNLNRREDGTRYTFASISAEDFPGVEIERLENGTSWSQTCYFIVMMLTDKSAQAVLDAVEVLEQNPLVKSASPNWVTWLDDDIEKGVTVGDVDGDNRITAEDALTVLKSVVGLQTLTDDQQRSADWNSDGVVDAADALGILQAVVGLS